jgi:hypothetical protein
MGRPRFGQLLVKRGRLIAPCKEALGRAAKPPIVPTLMGMEGVFLNGSLISAASSSHVRFNNRTGRDGSGRVRYGSAKGQLTKIRRSN